MKDFRLDESAVAIPETPPVGFFDKDVVSIPDIGEPTAATFLTVTNTDPTGWWIFEKYDGVRAFWNPQKRAFYSRFGKQFDMPQEIVDAMPTNTFLDGELWYL